MKPNYKIFRDIFVTFQRAGLHYYPQAATDPTLADVSYLGQKHRHLFKFKVMVEVQHNDRDVEFHQLLNWVESLYDSGTLSLNNQSCEMIAESLVNVIVEKFPKRTVSVEVSEDGECGAEITYVPETLYIDLAIAQ